MKKWTVDIRFSPACCVHSVEAETADEAERIVLERIDTGTLFLTKEQKSEMMDSLLENVESVECVGEEL